MPYPISPFNEDFNIDILYGSNDDSQNSQVFYVYYVVKLLHNKLSKIFVERYEIRIFKKH